MGSVAHADVWGYIDERGVAHFSNERVDARYELFYRGGESFDTTKTAKAVPEEIAPTPRAVAVPTVPAKLQAFFDVSPNFKAIRHHLKDAATTYKVDYELLQALIAAESGFDVQAVSPKGAMGLMQLMPDTARRYGVDGDKKVPIEKKLFDPKINVRTGTRYLRDLIAMFPGKLELALASYNAGEGAVIRAGNKIPNYKETQAYVKTVMQLYAGLKPPAALMVEKQQQRLVPPTRVRMEMLGGATGRRNMLAPFEPSPLREGALPGVFPNALPGSDLSMSPLTTLRE
jgi:soluble lytic murein transglycosylase-like protein